MYSFLLSFVYCLIIYLINPLPNFETQVEVNDVLEGLQMPQHVDLLGLSFVVCPQDSHQDLYAQLEGLGFGFGFIFLSLNILVYSSHFPLRSKILACTPFHG
jgi:hypothetical protein